MPILKLILNKFRFGVLLTAIAVLCTGCSGGGSSSANGSTNPTTRDGSLGLGSSSGSIAFTAVVGIPYINGNVQNTIYEDLYRTISESTSSTLSISRILLTIQNPGNAPDFFNTVFRIGDSFSLTDLNNGKAIGFLQQLANYNLTAKTPIEVYAYPDVEISSKWEKWQRPSKAPSTPSCLAGDAEADPSKKAMLYSICWTSLVNQLIAGDKPIISGVAYDNQSNYLANAHAADQPPFSPTGWTYTQAHGDSYKNITLNLGWITAKGVPANNADKVDLNLIEVYDLNSNKNPAYDALVPATAGLLMVSQSSSCTGALCAFDYSNAYPSVSGGTTTFKKFFPGTQYALNFPPTSPNFTPTLGANIYECALSNGSTSYGCNDQYLANVDTSLPIDKQVLQAMNYIWNAIPKMAPTGPYYGANGYLAGNVVYLFSTQYAGPVTGYYGYDKNTKITTTSKSLCVDPQNTDNLCSCVSSRFNSHASCGDENSFGSWGKNFKEFISFVTGFMSTQGGTNCPGNNCSAGIYMYDYVPQSWTPPPSQTPKFHKFLIR